MFLDLKNTFGSQKMLWDLKKCSLIQNIVDIVKIVHAVVMVDIVDVVDIDIVDVFF